MNRLSIFVPGLPKTQGSMRNVGRGAMVHSKGLHTWRLDVARVAKLAFHGELWDGPVIGEFVFHLPRPQRPADERAPDHGLDLDKLYRAIGDALEGVVYRNDARLCGVAVGKVFRVLDPGVEIDLRPLGARENPLWWRALGRL